MKNKEAKCVFDLSQSKNNVKGVEESKCIHSIIVYICSYFFFVYINTLDFYNFNVATISCLISPRSSAIGQPTAKKPMIMKKNLAR